MRREVNQRIQRKTLGTRKEPKYKTNYCTYKLYPSPCPLNKNRKKKNTKKADVCSMTKCADVIVHDVKDILYLQPLHQKLFCTISTV